MIITDYQLNLIIKLFNQEIVSCLDCDYLQYHSGSGEEYCMHKNDIVNTPNTAIDGECLFNHAITVYEMNSIGFEWVEPTNLFVKTTKNNTIEVSQQNDDVYYIRVFDDKSWEIYSFEMKITSLPHMKFIIESLNIE